MQISLNEWFFILLPWSISANFRPGPRPASVSGNVPAQCHPDDNNGTEN